MSEDDLLFPTSTNLVDPDWVDTNLGLEEGAGSCAAGKRDRVVARTVAVDGGGDWRAGGFG